MIQLFATPHTSVVLAVRARDACWWLKYALNGRARQRNARFTKQETPDGFAMPSPYLVYLVTGQFDLEAFYQNGKLGADCIKAILSKNGFDINDFHSILDFGCGCGRVLRHWKTPKGPTLYGSDYNARLVKWCRNAL